LDEDAHVLNVLLNSTGQIEEGALYRRPDTGSVTETAEVLEVAEDKMGIPHVRFQLHVIRGTDARTEQRTLALDIFYARYRERIYDG
jgi:hypothetical protein